ncbi:MAG: 50S ribosomal protein L22 [Clostridiaceae bacterium]|jgi:large subunit ribosomal protein L22|nr:50S ribosomal protein L22 [Clostridiaceae bacterium]
MATRTKQKALERKNSKDTRPKAIARYIRISPDKVRIVLNIIRGRSLNDAVAVLENTPKAASEVLLKVVNSAAANAENNLNMSRNDLYVAECFADQGPILKRIMPRAKGRAYRINKRTSHITVILDAVK